MVNLTTLKAANAKRWANAKLTRKPEFDAVAKRLLAAKARYQAVEARTGVPWPAIAVIHEREASQRWDTQLGQGDLLSQVSVHVPAGRGPFKRWEDGAFDALVDCPPFAARNRDWSIGGTLTKLEEYNGFGYAARRLPSPYLWSGTDQYRSGKYVRDGVFDPSVVDKQLGCAGLLMAMMALDPSIAFTPRVVPPASVPAVPKPALPSVPTPPSIAHPAKGSIGDVISRAFAALFSVIKRQ